MVFTILAEVLICIIFKQNIFQGFVFGFNFPHCVVNSHPYRSKNSFSINRSNKSSSSCFLLASASSSISTLIRILSSQFPLLSSYSHITNLLIARTILITAGLCDIMLQFSAFSFISQEIYNHTPLYTPLITLSVPAAVNIIS